MKNIKKKEDILSDLVILNNFLIENKVKNKCGMNITMVNGFLYSLVSSPCLIMPSDWLFIIFGGFPEFQSVKQQEKVYVSALALHAYISNYLASHNKNGLSLWITDGKIVDLNMASDSVLVDFCSGYIKGYLMDPILKNLFSKIPDLSLAFFLAIVKLGVTTEKDIKLSSFHFKKNKITPRGIINEKIRGALQYLIAENYLIWLELRNLNLPKTYFHHYFYSGKLE